MCVYEKPRSTLRDRINGRHLIATTRAYTYDMTYLDENTHVPSIFRL